MNDEFENALAWFQAAPADWLKNARQDLNACAEWIWGVLQGDFNDNATTAQTATSTVISMIPFVDQICDVRDVVANCKKINEEPDVNWYWIALVLTLIGLFPTVGSLLKGCGKVMFAGIRKAAHKSGVAEAASRGLDTAVTNLNRFLEYPEVKKTLKALKIDNPYKFLSAKVQQLAAQVNKPTLVAAFNEARNAAESLLNLVKRWGNEALASRAGKLLIIIDKVARFAPNKLAQVAKPVQDLLNKLAARLNIEADMMHRARLNTTNPHAWKYLSEAEELDKLERAKPRWVDVRADLPYSAKTSFVPEPGWPDVSDTGPKVLRGKYDTFHKMNAEIIPPGTKIYRVIAPSSADNSICWMSESEFRKLTSKDEWRRRFAVWASWNNNGEFVTYVVPPGPGLRVWSGPAASQRMSQFVLEGGGEQIVLDPATLEKAFLGRRQPTNWGYDNFGEKIDLTGVPVLTNNWK